MKLKSLITNRQLLPITILMLFPVMNMLFMHYYIYCNHYMEDVLLAYDYVNNILMVIFDVTIVLLLFLFFSWGHLKQSFLLTFVSTWIWSFVNVFYVRFFYQYLPLSVMSQTMQLTDQAVINSMMAGFQLSDLFYPISFVFFIFTYRRIGSLILSRWLVSYFLCISIVSFIGVFMVYSFYHLMKKEIRTNTMLYQKRIVGLLYLDARNAYPNSIRFTAGSIRVLIGELYDMFHQMELTDHQRNEIVAVYSDLSLRITNHQSNCKIRNVIFIILESFLSAPIDLKVDGKEITPFLNFLKQQDDTYYNSHVMPNITMGESGDGQFIYMTGVLPLRDGLVVGEAKNLKMPAFPRLLARQFGIKYSEIVMPSPPQVWEQEQMNKVYGIEKMYCNRDLLGPSVEYLNDEQVFSMAMKSPAYRKQPFFSMVLNYSTHQPYRTPIDNSIVLTDTSLPEGYRNYLTACHYTDKWLHVFFDYLKQKKIYDNSLIVIASDHHAHLDALGMSSSLTKELPLFIIHGGIDKSHVWTGTMNQLDVFTTLLDVLNIGSDWHGLGYTVLSPDYKNSLTEHAWVLSEWIVKGNFFGTLKNREK